jgi:hypothetical protein
MVHVSTNLILPCRSGCSIVSITVDVRICAWCWSLICLLSRTPISIVLSLTTTVAQSNNTRILCITISLWWRRCRVRRLKTSELNLMLQSLESLTHSLHSGLSNLLTWAEIRSLRGRTNTNPHVGPLRSSALHHPFTLNNSSSIFKD